MTLKELIEELKIRFNTEPRRYEKKDFRVLISILEKLLKTDEIATETKEEMDYIKSISSIKWQGESDDDKEE